MRLILIGLLMYLGTVVPMLLVPTIAEDTKAIQAIKTADSTKATKTVRAVEDTKYTKPDQQSVIHQCFMEGYTSHVCSYILASDYLALIVEFNHGRTYYGYEDEISKTILLSTRLPFKMLSYEFHYNGNIYKSDHCKDDSESRECILFSQEAADVFIHDIMTNKPKIKMVITVLDLDKKYDKEVTYEFDFDTAELAAHIPKSYLTGPVPVYKKVEPPTYDSLTTFDIHNYEFIQRFAFGDPEKLYMGRNNKRKYRKFSPRDYEKVIAPYHSQVMAVRDQDAANCAGGQERLEKAIRVDKKQGHYHLWIDLTGVRYYPNEVYVIYENDQPYFVGTYEIIHNSAFQQIEGLTPEAKKMLTFDFCAVGFKINLHTGVREFRRHYSDYPVKLQKHKEFMHIQYQDQLAKDPDWYKKYFKTTIDLINVYLSTDWYKYYFFEPDSFEIRKTHKDRDLSRLMSTDPFGYMFSGDYFMKKLQGKALFPFTAKGLEENISDKVFTYRPMQMTDRGFLIKNFKGHKNDLIYVEDIIGDELENYGLMILEPKCVMNEIFDEQIRLGRYEKTFEYEGPTLDRNRDLKDINWILVHTNDQASENILKKIQANHGKTKDRFCEQGP